ncbi:MAG: TetR family transcriptional regulator [Gammaproteobacteria bacterium]|jgi:AcrR family transcriptional regulator|nr:TetR family transcriptional regulator [Gammaproteobacteria bacterium]
MKPSTEPCTARGEQRRSQILDAATGCFAREGFHGTSIATISKAAAMSTGHIYHFFASKEAIIAALIERKLAQSLELVSHFENAEDVFQAMLERVDQGLQERTDPAQAALELEILAEAARNPRVAALVREADAIRRERLMGVVRSARQNRTSRDTGNTSDKEDDSAAVTEVVIALFEGLTARAVNNPTLERTALAQLLRQVLRALL